MSKKTKISATTGISLVVASMVGTGAFTSLGFQLVDLKNPGTILTLWLAGGLMALSGAFSYAEVGTAIKRSGGEYTFLSELFNPLLGYLSGWISLTVGFAAPIALSAIACIEYLPFHIPYARLFGVLLIVGLTAIHSLSLNTSAKFQNITTLLKILLISSIIVLGLVLSPETNNALSLNSSFIGELKSTAFAVALIYVSYSYSGWNAAAYITGEFKNPEKSLPIALIAGTILVTVLYSFLQIIFLKHASYDQLSGSLNVGTIAIQQMLGPQSSIFFSGAISLLLISGISAMIWTGPRVTSSIAKDHLLWKSFTNPKKGIPVKALWFQAILSSVLLFSGTFEQIMIYCGILLNISALLTVFGVIRLRRIKKVSFNSQAKKNKTIPKDYKSPLFPFFQILFILMSIWIIGFSIINKPIEAIMGIGNLIVGIFTFLISNSMTKKYVLKSGTLTKALKD